jgi:hypothetical protein
MPPERSLASLDASQQAVAYYYLYNLVTSKVSNRPADYQQQESRTFTLIAISDPTKPWPRFRLKDLEEDRSLQALNVSGTCIVTTHIKAPSTVITKHIWLISKTYSQVQRNTAHSLRSVMLTWTRSYSIFCATAFDCNHKHNLGNNNGGGGPNRRWVLRTLFYKGIEFEIWENWSHKTQVFHFLFSVYFSSATIQFSNQINYPLAPPPPSYAYDCNYTL